MRIPSYYCLPFARAALPARLRAVERATPPAAAVLDIGCNDATISRHLLQSGRARRIVAVDSLALREPLPRGMEFIRADARNLRLGALGPFNLVLALNLLHHVADESLRAAKELVQDILDSAEAALVDMGSFTEHGPWRWRRTFEAHWRDDESMWEDLFAGAPRWPVLRYPAMGGGHRVMWHLQGRARCPADTPTGAARLP